MAVAIIDAKYLMARDQGGSNLKSMGSLHFSTLSGFSGHSWSKLMRPRHGSIGKMGLEFKVCRNVCSKYYLGSVGSY